MNNIEQMRKVRFVLYKWEVYLAIAATVLFPNMSKTVGMKYSNFKGWLRKNQETNR